MMISLKRKEPQLLILHFILILIFLRPHPNFLPGIVAVYGADLLILLGILFGALSVGYKIKQEFIPIIQTIFFLLISLTVISFIIFLVNQIHLPLLFNLARFFYYGLVFLYLLGIFDYINNPFFVLRKSLDVYFVLIFIVSLFQLLDPPFLGDLVKTTFGSDKLRSIWIGYPRVFGTFFNANWFGVYIVFSGLGWLSFFSKKIIGIKELVLRLVPLLFLLAISGSRTAFIGFAVGVGIQVFNKVSFKIKNVAIAIASLVGLIGMMRVLSNWVPLFANTFERFFHVFDNLVKNIENIGDIMPGRVETWVKSIEFISDKPFLGYGDNNLGFIPHNSYFSLLLTFGIIGTVLISFSIICLIYFVKKNSKPSQEFFVLGKWAASFGLAFLIMSLAADFFYTSQVMLLIILIGSMWTFYGLKGGEKTKVLDNIKNK